MKEQLNEKKAQVEDLQLQLGKREEELTQAFMRIDEEAASMSYIYIYIFLIVFNMNDIL